MSCCCVPMAGINSSATRPIIMPTLGDTNIDTRVFDRGGNTDAPFRLSMAWSSLSDVDLHLLEPTGRHIYYSSKYDLLDVDMNAGSSSSSEPVENISYTDLNNAPDGVYKLAYVQYRVADLRLPRADVPLFKINRRYEENGSFKNDFALLRPRWDNKNEDRSTRWVVAEFEKTGDIITITGLPFDCEIEVYGGGRVRLAPVIKNDLEFR